MQLESSGSDDSAGRRSQLSGNPAGEASSGIAATHEAFGLRWQIPWTFHRFAAIHSEGLALSAWGMGEAATVVVSQGVSDWPDDPAVVAGPFLCADHLGTMWLRVPGAATFAVRGLEVIVEMEHDGDPELRDLALAGPVAAMVVRNAGMVPVRGTAVRDGHHAAVILGASAIGVSTLAAALMVRGYQLVGDDLVALIPQPGRAPLVAGGGHLLQLPSDTEAALRSRLGVAGVRLRGDAAIARLDVPLSVAPDKPELAAVYALDAEATNEVRKAPIAGLARMETIQAADWHRVLRHEQGYDSDDFVAAAAVTAGVAMRRVSRLDGPELHVGELSRVVKRDFRAVCRALQESHA